MKFNLFPILFSFLEVFFKVALKNLSPQTYKKLYKNEQPSEEAKNRNTK